MRISDWKDWARSNVTNILRLLIVLLFLGLAIWAITLNRYGLVIANHEPWLWLTVALISVGPELAGIVIGVVTIDYLNELRQDKQLKEQLILQMGSTHNDVTDTAIRALQARGWLYDGKLSGAFLPYANFSGGRLMLANLNGVSLQWANLRGANLARANLSEADLFRADLSGAFLFRISLQSAALFEANLSGSDISEADLSGASLGGANLSRANLDRADLNEASLYGANLSEAKNWTIKQLEQAEELWETIMPDGIQLGIEETEGSKHMQGPTFEEWKAQYLARQKAEKAERKPGGEPDEMVSG